MTIECFRNAFIEICSKSNNASTQAHRWLAHGGQRCLCGSDVCSVMSNVYIRFLFAALFLAVFIRLICSTDIHLRYIRPEMYASRAQSVHVFLCVCFHIWLLIAIGWCFYRDFFSRLISAKIRARRVGDVRGRRTERGTRRRARTARCSNAKLSIIGTSIAHKRRIE